MSDDSDLSVMSVTEGNEWRTFVQNLPASTPTWIVVLATVALIHTWVSVATALHHGRLSWRTSLPVHCHDRWWSRTVDDEPEFCWDQENCGHPLQVSTFPSLEPLPTYHKPFLCIGPLPTHSHNCFIVYVWFRSYSRTPYHWRMKFSVTVSSQCSCCLQFSVAVLSQCIHV